MNTTVRVKGHQVYKDWHVVDAAGRPLGRLATEVARLLTGKHKPTYEPHLDDGDFVIVVNAKKVRLSGAKPETKVYYRHSGYPGGLRSRSFEEQLARFPDKVIRQAVWGMLPKGPLGRAMLRHLKVYGGPDHPHESQVVGSERAAEKREVALAWRPPHLRPLASVDAELGEAEDPEQEAPQAPDAAAEED